MATTKEYRDFILEQLNLADDITVKPMMGEYLLYFKGKLFGGIYDNRLLVKITESNKKYELTAALPYDGAKPMFLIDCVDDREKLKNIVFETYKGLL
ncbi:MAG: TfoX/Sxy family protein [Christensenellaceae bacterium]